MDSFSQWDLVTYPGLMFCVVAIIGGLKKLFPAWINGKEAYLGLFLSYVLGIAAKLTIPNAFMKVHWVVFLVSLLFVAVGAKLGHDHFLNEIIKGQSPDKQLDAKVSAKVDETLDDKVAAKVDEKMAEIKKG